MALDAQDVREELGQHKAAVNLEFKEQSNEIRRVTDKLIDLDKRLTLFESLQGRLETSVEQSCESIDKFSNQLNRIDIEDLIKRQNKTKWENFRFAIAVAVATPITIAAIRLFSAILNNL